MGVVAHDKSLSARAVFVARYHCYLWLYTDQTVTFLVPSHMNGIVHYTKMEMSFW